MIKNIFIILSLLLISTCLVFSDEIKKLEDENGGVVYQVEVSGEASYNSKNPEISKKLAINDALNNAVMKVFGTLYTKNVLFRDEKVWRMLSTKNYGIIQGYDIIKGSEKIADGVHRISLSVKVAKKVTEEKYQKIRKNQKVAVNIIGDSTEILTKRLSQEMKDFFTNTSLDEKILNKVLHKDFKSNINLLEKDEITENSPVLVTGEIKNSIRDFNAPIGFNNLTYGLAVSTIEITIYIYVFTDDGEYRSLGGVMGPFSSELKTFKNRINISLKDRIDAIYYKQIAGKIAKRVEEYIYGKPATDYYKLVFKGKQDDIQELHDWFADQHSVGYFLSYELKDFDDTRLEYRVEVNPQVTKEVLTYIIKESFNLKKNNGKTFKIDLNG